MSFNEIVNTLNRRGHNFSYKHVPKESFAGLFPGAARQEVKAASLNIAIDLQGNRLHGTILETYLTQKS